MKAQPIKRQMPAGAALSAKRGESEKSDLRGAFKEMNGSEFEIMTSTEQNDLPEDIGS